MDQEPVARATGIHRLWVFGGLAVYKAQCKVGGMGKRKVYHGRAGIANATVTGSAVYINTTTGQLGLLSSSERFKDAIEPMGKASEANQRKPAADQKNSEELN